MGEKHDFLVESCFFFMYKLKIVYNNKSRLLIE